MVEESSRDVAVEAATRVGKRMAVHQTREAAVVQEGRCPEPPEQNTSMVYAEQGVDKDDNLQCHSS